MFRAFWGTKVFGIARSANPDTPSAQAPATTALLRMHTAAAHEATYSRPSLDDEARLRRAPPLRARPRRLAEETQPDVGQAAIIPRATASLTPLT